MRRFLVLTLLSFCSCWFTIHPVPRPEKEPAPRPPGRDTLILTKGGEEEGRLEEVNEKEVIFTTREGKRLRYSRDEVQSVEMQKLRKGYAAETVSELKDGTLTATLSKMPTAKDYPTAHYVVLRDETEIRFEGAGATVRRRRIIRVLSERGKAMVGNRAMSYLPDRQKMKILWARTIVPEEGAECGRWRVHHLKDMYIEDGAVYPSEAGYDLLRRKKFALKPMAPGVVVDVCVEEVWDRTDALRPFARMYVFGGQEPILRKEVRVTCGEGRDVTIRIEGDDGRLKKKQDGATTTITAENLRVLEREDDTPPVVDLLPVVVVSTSDGDWKALARRFKEAAAASVSATEAVKAEAERLTGDATTEKEKAAAIYRFIACKKDFLPMDLDSWRLTPHEPDWSLAASRLAAVDKVALSKALLSACGISSRIYLVRTRAAGHLPRENPSLGFFDGVALQALVGGEKVWFCGWDESVAMGYLPARLQGGPALSIPDGRVTEMPVLPPESEASGLEVEGELKADGTLEAEVKVVVKGEAEAAWRARASFTEERMRQQFAALAQRLHPFAVVLEWKAENLGDPTAPLEIRYKVRVPGFATALDKRLVSFRVPGVEYSAWGLLGKRKLPLFFDRADRVFHRVRLRLPKGVKAHLPPARRNVGDAALAGYSLEYRLEGDVLVFEDALERRALVVSAADYPEYKKVMSMGARVARELVLLERQAKEDGTEKPK